MAPRSFVYRADKLINGRDLYLVIPDRGDEPMLERSFQVLDGRPMFLPAPEEVTEVVDEDGRGLAAVVDATRVPLCTADPALAAAAAVLGVPRADATPSVVRSATAAVLTGAWGAQATAIADAEVFVPLIEACRAAAAFTPDPERLPIHIEFSGSTNNRHLSPHSTLLRAPLPTGEPGFLLALHAEDIEAIEELVADGRYPELVAYDFIHVAFTRAPAFAARLFDVLHGFPVVPSVARTDGGRPVLLSAEDVLTLASALEVYVRGESCTLVAGTLEVSARLLGHHDFPRAVPEQIVRVQLAELPDEAYSPDGHVRPAWERYFAAVCHAAIGDLAAAYETLLALYHAPDPRVRELSIQGGMRVGFELPAEDFARITAAANERDLRDPEIRARIERNEAMIAAEHEDS